MQKANRSDQFGKLINFDVKYIHIICLYKHF